MGPRLGVRAGPGKQGARDTARSFTTRARESVTGQSNPSSSACPRPDPPRPCTHLPHPPTWKILLPRPM
ncbi:MAG: hypothetical protein ACK559_40370, partial [bacterium]